MMQKKLRKIVKIVNIGQYLSNKNYSDTCMGHSYNRGYRPNRLNDDYYRLIH